MDNRPHSREKRVGQGSVGAEKGRRVNSGGPVGGGQGGGAFPGGPRRSGGSRGPKRAGGGIGLVGLILIVLFTFLRGGSDDVQTAPVSTPRPTAYVTSAPSHTLAPQQEGLESIDDANMLFSSDDYGDLSELIGSLFGYGESYSGTNPSGSSDTGSGLLQDLPGVQSTPKPTQKPASTPKPTAKPTAAPPM